LPDFLKVEHVVVAAGGRSQEVVERFFQRRGIKRKIALRVAHFLGVPLIVAASDLVATVPWAVARDFAEMSPRLAVALPPFDIPGFELKLHWHRRFDNEPRSRWFRDLLVQVFQEDRRSTMPPEPRGERKRTKTGT